MEAAIKRTESNAPVIRRLHELKGLNIAEEPRDQMAMSQALLNLDRTWTEYTVIMRETMENLYRGSALE
jgi:hypothetical protein